MLELTGKNAIQIWPSIREVPLDQVTMPAPSYKCLPGLKGSVIFEDIVEMISRVVPDLKSAYLVPNLDSSGEPRAGAYFPKDDKIILSYSNYSPDPYFRATVYHELFHAVQERLDPKLRDDLYNQSVRAVAYGDEDYLDLVTERTARQFEYQSMWLDTGGRYANSKKVSIDEDPNFPTGLFYHVYRGGFAIQRSIELKAMEAADRRREKCSGLGSLVGLNIFNRNSKKTL